MRKKHLVLLVVAFVLLAGWLIFVHLVAAPPSPPTVRMDAVKRAAATLYGLLSEKSLAPPQPGEAVWDRDIQAVALRWGSLRLISRGNRPPVMLVALAQAVHKRVQDNTNLRARLSGKPLMLSFIGRDKGIPLQDSFLWNFTVLPGVDGLLMQTRTGRRYVLPEETLHVRFFGGRVFPFLPLRFGLNRRALGVSLNGQRPVPPGTCHAVPLALTGLNPRKALLRRFRARTFVCRERGGEIVVRPSFRLMAPVPEALTASDIKKSGQLAGDWFVRHLNMQNGIFSYRYDPWHDRKMRGGYSLPRHAGSVLILYRIYGLLGDKRYLERADAALDYLLMRLRPAVKGQFVGGEGVKGKLGTTALTALALFARRKVTGEKDNDDELNALLDFMEYMVLPSGWIASYYDNRRRSRDKKTVAQNFPGQALWALSMGVRRLGRDPAAFIRGMDYQTRHAWSFFLSDYYIFPFSWEMQAIAEVAPKIRKERWADFLFRTADSMLDFQYGSGWPFPDYTGGFGTPEYFVPLAHAAGFQGEGISAAFGYARRHAASGRAERYRRALILMSRFLLSQQVVPETALLYPNPLLAIGAFRGGPADHRQQIDYTQHIYAALLNSLEEGVFDK